jgi:hypothetical protein
VLSTFTITSVNIFHASEKSGIVRELLGDRDVWFEALARAYSASGALVNRGIAASLVSKFDTVTPTRRMPMSSG